MLLNVLLQNHGQGFISVQNPKLYKMYLLLYFDIISTIKQNVEYQFPIHTANI